jgi:Gram-negative porin
MRRVGRWNSRFAAAVLLCALSTRSTGAKADIVLHDAGGWRFFTTGRVEAHYQLIMGDGDPISNNRLVGGQIQNTVSQDQNNNLVDSRIRSGFVGSQIGFGVSNKISESLEAKAFMSVWLDGIDSDKGTPPDTKDVDFREAWGSLAGPFGTFSFGRAFSIFGSASGEVNKYAFEYAVGHPCLADTSTIACGSVGAGPLYAGFNAQLRYATPRVAGFQLQASMEDPSSLPDYHITHLPRFEGEINYETHFPDDGKLVVQGQGLQQQLGKINSTQTGTTFTDAWGVMGAARLEIAGFKLGGGAWTGKGMGTDTPLQQDDQAKPLAQDLPAGNQPGDVLRSFRGFFGNVVYDYHGTALAVGAGAAFVQETAADAAAISTSLLKQNVEYHAVFTQRIHSIVISAEYMHWRSDWYLGEYQRLNFVGGGATFAW